MRRSKISLTVDQRFEGLERRVYELEKDLRNKSNHIDRLEAQILEKLSPDIFQSTKLSPGHYWVRWRSDKVPERENTPFVVEILSDGLVFLAKNLSPHNLSSFEILSSRLVPPQL